MCMFDNRCGQHVVVEYNGDVYACDFFVQPEWKYGNLLDIPLPKLVSTEIYTSFVNRKKNWPESCRRCKWLEYCYGGCPKYRGLTKGEDQNKFYFCETYKAFFEYCMPRIKHLAKKFIKMNKTQEAASRIGRNDPCPCGSGFKYKHCCGG